MNLLHLDSSALGGYSVSRQLTADIVAELKRSTPDVHIRYHDLAAQPLPHWTPVADASDPAAVLGNQLLEEFLAADVVVERRLGDPGGTRQVLHAGRVVAAGVELGDRHGEQ